MRNITKALTVVSLLAPVSGHTLGIGDIRVRSSLNQNLNAEINLVAARGERPSNIKVSLAPAEKFDEAGIPWTYFLSKLRFQPIVKSNGNLVIKVTSREALKEPYLNFLLEVSWPKGNLYREFTVLVDPPAEYEHPSYQEPAYQEPIYPTSSSYDEVPIRQKEYVPRHKPVRHRHRATTKPRRIAAGSYGRQIVTRRNDTLWNMAARARGAGVSVEQMMMALYNQNPHAFYQQNVNALSAGKTLKVPDKEAVQQISRQEALAAFDQHNQAWNNNRSGVPGGNVQVASDQPADNQLKLEAPAEATVTATESVSPASEQAESTKTATGSSVSSAKGTATGTAPVDQALQNKIEALEKQMATMQELITLKDKQLADLQNPGQTTPPTQTPPAQATTPQSAPPVVAPTAPTVQVPPAPVTPPQQPTQAVPTPPTQTKPVVTPKPAVKPPVKKIAEPEPIEESSILPWALGLLGTSVLSIFGWLWWRKQKVLKETEEESMFRNYSTMRYNDSKGSHSSTMRKGGLATGESSFLNDFKTSDFESFESFNVDHSDIDPLAEADVYLAYGRYQQAEDLMKDAIKDHPDRDDCKLKLLEIYHASSSKEEFVSYAAELVKAGKKEDGKFWAKVIELSKDISSDTTLFTALAQNSVAVFPTESETLTENVLFDVASPEPNQTQEQTRPAIEEVENLGTATFEIDDGTEGGALFEAGATEVQESAEQEAHSLPTEADEAKKPDLEEKVSFDGSLDENESLDFDLGPYPGSATKSDTGASTSTPNQSSLDNNFTPSLEDGLDDGAVESYEFDFNPDKMAGNQEVKIEAKSDKKTWDAENTLEFSLDDDLTNADLLNEDETIDLNFDLELPQAREESPKAKEFGVSDLTDMDEVETKLDLAKAYIDMGDAMSAKDIIEQVLENGSPEQKKMAQSLLDELS